jgi:hypothetical protein
MILSLIITLSGAATVATQPQAQVAPRPVTSEAIVAAIGNDAGARRVIQLVLGDLFAHSSGREFVLASQIPALWFPPLIRAEIVRLADADVDRHLAACGRYWVASDVKRTDNVVSLWVSERCGCSGREYLATFEDGAWQLGPPRAGTGSAGWRLGIACGCAGAPPGCPCFGR